MRSTLTEDVCVPRSKVPAMLQQVNEIGVRAMQAAVRRALDPAEVFNPGKG